MNLITAEFIWIDGKWQKDIVLSVNEDGKIIEIGNNSLSTIKKYHGVIIPAFVNAHCHLELTHMFGMIPTGTGLIQFITDILKKREFPDKTILESTQTGDDQMYKNGIQAVGDISNTLFSQKTKLHSKIKYHTFVETYDLFQGLNGNPFIDQHMHTFESFKIKDGDKKTMVPHAPYSVSKDVFDIILQKNIGIEGSISIHNQETDPENELFQTGTGKFRKFYENINLSLDQFTPTNTPSISYALQHMDPQRKTLFVHNTKSTEQDIQEAEAWSPNCFWVSCPNANLYIENSLPSYSLFTDNDVKLCLGTDGICANWQLDILEEMKTISRYCSHISPETLIQWATINGAEALGFEKEIGSIIVDKNPGLLNLNYNPNSENAFFEHHRVNRLF